MSMRECHCIRVPGVVTVGAQTTWRCCITPPIQLLPPHMGVAYSGDCVRRGVPSKSVALLSSAWSACERVNVVREVAHVVREPVGGQRASA